MKEIIHGYPSAADFIASDPAHSFTVYKCFEPLSSRNLLYLEAEFELEQEQDDLDISDSRGDIAARDFLRSWTKPKISTNPHQMSRLALIERIRSKIKEYR